MAAPALAPAPALPSLYSSDDASATERYVLIQFNHWIATNPGGEQTFAIDIGIDSLSVGQRLQCRDALVAEDFVVAVQAERADQTPMFHITFHASRIADKVKRDTVRAKNGTRIKHIWTDELDAKIVADRAKGKQFRAIAKELGVSMASVKEQYALVRGRRT